MRLRIHHHGSARVAASGPASIYEHLLCGRELDHADVRRARIYAFAPRERFMPHSLCDFLPRPVARHE
jgi:hypothetical protein